MQSLELRSEYILTGCYPFNNAKKRVLALTLRHLEDLSVLASMGEPENERRFTCEIFNDV